MAELQTVTAAFNIAQLALTAARLIHRVIKGAKSEADTLFRRTHHIASLAETVAAVVKSREAARGHAPRSSVERSIYESIDYSLEECRKSLSFINEQLQPFQDVTQAKPLGKLQRNFEFICSDDFRKAQESIIESQLQSLSLSISLLNSLDIYNHKTLYVDTILTLNHNVRQEVTFQQQRQKALAREKTIPVPALESSDSRNNIHAHRSEDCQHCQRVELDSPLCIAVKKSDATSVRDLITAGENVRVIEETTGKTLLHHAAEHLDAEVLIELLKTSETHDPTFLNIATTEGETALMIAADKVEEALSYHLADALLKRGCDVNLEDTANRSAMYIAIDGPTEPYRVRFARLLYDGGADFESLRERHPRNFENFRTKIDPSIPPPRRHSVTLGLSRSQTAPTNSPTERRQQSLDSSNPNRRRNSETSSMGAESEPTKRKTSIITKLSNWRRNSTPDLAGNQVETVNSPRDNRRASVVTSFSNPFSVINEQVEDKL